MRRRHRPAWRRGVSSALFIMLLVWGTSALAQPYSADSFMDDDAFRFHATISFGHAWIDDGVDALYDSSNIAGRLRAGVDWSTVGAAVSIFGTDLDADRFSEASSFSFGPELGAQFPVYTDAGADDSFFGVAVGARLGFCFSSIIGYPDGSLEDPELSGTSVYMGLSVVAEGAGAQWGEFRLRGVTDVIYEVLWLESGLVGPLDGAMVHWTGGVGMSR